MSWRNCKPLLLCRVAENRIRHWWWHRPRNARKRWKIQDEILRLSRLSYPRADQMRERERLMRCLGIACPLRLTEDEIAEQKALKNQALLMGKVLTDCVDRRPGYE